MKRLVNNIGLSLAAVALSASSSLADGIDLRAISDSESKWTKGELSIDGREEKVGAVLTGSGSYRITQLPARLQTTAILESPDFRNEDRFKEWCETMQQAFPAAKTDRYPKKYILRVNINPFTKQLVLRTPGGSAARVENPAELASYRTEIALSSAAAAYEQTRINTAAFNNLINQQLLKQESEMRLSGVASIDLTGWDDVACDLYAGHALFNFYLAARLEQPFVERQTVVTKDQFKSMYRDLKDVWKPQTNALANHIIGAALLGASMPKAMNRNAVELGFGNYVSLHLKMFETLSGKLTDLDDSGVTAAARDLDKLSRNTQAVYTTVTPRVTYKSSKSWGY